MSKKSKKEINYKLNLHDLFKFSAVLSDFGNTAVLFEKGLSLSKEGKNEEEVGMEIALILIERFPKIENSLPKFLDRFTDKDAMEIELEELKEIVKMILENNNFADFLQKAMKSMAK